jgi:single-stranded-DNA-specific exonuclease
VERITEAMQAGEKIVIFGDYDADGVPGTAVLAEFFRFLKYPHFEVYLPDRHNEQYGLSVMAIEKLAQAGADLIITVDCGIANVAEVAHAAKLGVEVIITDHHLVGEVLPEAFAILNPKQADDGYPYKMLCGAGVAFKLVQALVKKSGTSFPAGWEKWLLDLVGIATISDMVPLDGENRILAYYGLKVLRKTRRVGLLHLYRKLNLRSEYLNEDDIGFMIGPRLNTASRMSHALQAYQLLVTQDPATAETIADHLEEKNSERKLSVDTILNYLDGALAVELPAVIVAGREDWSLGVLGLSASRVVEKYGRSVFLWSKNGQGEIRGSCRSDGTINVVELMRAAGGPELFSNFGGHAGAGGFAISADLLPELTRRLASAYELVPRQSVVPELVIDRELPLDVVNDYLAGKIQSLAPFGMGNPKPQFLFKRVRVAEFKLFGATGNHLELTLEAVSGKTIKAIAFFNPFGDLDLLAGDDVDVVATIETSYFRGRPELRLRIVDLRKAS